MTPGSESRKILETHETYSTRTYLVLVHYSSKLSCLLANYFENGLALDLIFVLWGFS